MTTNAGSGSYWSTGDKINIGQTDIEIKCEGNDEFEAGQVIGIFIPPSVQFFDGASSRLQFDVEFTYPVEAGGTPGAKPRKWCLDSTTGANGLFSKVVTYAGNRQSVLETTEHYSSWVSVKYDYDTNDSLKSRRAMSEGTGEWTPSTRGQLGGRKSHQNNHMTSPFNTYDRNEAPTDTQLAAQPYTKASVSIPIHMGMFAGGTRKAYPNVIMGGAYIELTLEANVRVFRAFDSTTENRSIAQCPTFHSLDGAGAGWSAGSNQVAFYTQNFNSQFDPDHSPFQVGSRVGFVDLNTGVENVMTDAAGLGTGCEITGIEAGTGVAKIKYTCTACSPASTLNFHTASGDPNFAMFQKINDVATSEVAPTYKLSNVRLIVRQLALDDYARGMMKRMKSGGVVQFDLPSIATSVASATKNELQTSIAIPCEHSKARSIVCMPTDNEQVYTIAQNIDSTATYLIDTLDFNPKSAFLPDHYSDRSGVSGIGDFLTSYNFNIDNKIVPSRKVNTNKSSARDRGANADHLIELEKALQQSHGVPPRSFSSFKKNFLIGRALTLSEDTIYDGRGQDIRLIARYEETTQPQKNKLWKFFTSHIKTISVKGDSINVQN